MKKLLLVLVAFVAIVAAVVASSGQAKTHRMMFPPSPGYVGYSFGGPCSGCGVDIHNVTTGGNGRTVTDGNGNYSFTGILAYQNYQVRVNTCKVHSYFVSPWSYTFPGSAAAYPVLVAQGSGSC